MAKRIIEEAFQAIRPKRRAATGATTAPIGVQGSGTNLSVTLSSAGQQITQLQNAYQQQALLIAANTQAIASNTASRSSSAAGTIVRAATAGLGGGFGVLSPLVSGIARLFGGGNQSVPAALPVYSPPPPVSISAGLRSGYAPVAVPQTGPGNSSSPALARTEAPGTATGELRTQALHTTQVTVHVNAMDSQSFMDRSSDIASAVREAMLNLHPINDVIGGL